MFQYYLGEYQLNNQRDRKPNMLSIDQRKFLKECHFYELYEIDFLPRDNMMRQNLNNFKVEIIVINGIREKFGMIRVTSKIGTKRK